MNCSKTLYIRVTDGIVSCRLLNRKIQRKERNIKRRKRTKAADDIIIYNHYLPVSWRKIIGVYDCCTHDHTPV